MTHEDKARELLKEFYYPNMSEKSLEAVIASALASAEKKGREEGFKKGAATISLEHGSWEWIPNETLKKTWNEAIDAAAKAAEEYPCEELKEWKFQDEIADKIKSLRK